MRPIGFFDSGLGGVSTLRQAMRAMPGEHFIYYGDHAHSPYGQRSEEEIFLFTSAALRRLCDMGAKALVIACNTATAAVLGRLELPVPVVGLVPAVEQALLETPDEGLILMMATEATTRMPYYQSLLASLPGKERIQNVPCPGEVVTRIESGVIEPGSYLDLLGEVLAPYHGAQVAAIVLGCTHYPFIQEDIYRYGQLHFACAPTRFFEGGAHAIGRLQAMLEEKSEAAAGGPGSVRFYTSGDEHRLKNLFETLLQVPIPMRGVAI